jgi:formiminotetrahydrofolate cyclodeaminase
VEKDLLAQTGNIKIDMTYYGFVVESEKPVSGGGSSCDCSSAGSCGSAGSGGCGC